MSSPEPFPPPESTTPLLRLQNCSFETQYRLLLDDLSFTIEPGTLNCIVGPNGAGKSTLVKLISGEWAPTTGSVFLHEKVLTDYGVRDLAALRSVVSQFHDAHFGFRCSEVIAMSFDALSGDDSIRAQEHADCAVDMMQIGSLVMRRFDRLSGGEQQRVMLARALTQLGIADKTLENKLLILDEPSSSMDIHHQQNLFALLNQLCAKGLTVIAVIHNLNQVYRHADYVMILQEGKLVSHDVPESALCPLNIEKYFAVNSSLVIAGNQEKHLLVHD